MTAGVVELELAPGTKVLGEYWHADNHGCSVVTLHDRDRDLDDMRGLARMLHRAGFNVVSLDLPGHGLSGGDYDSDSVDAIAAAALFADPNDDRGVCFVAEGATCDSLLRATVRQPVAMALLRPRVTSWPADCSVWHSTPALYIVDPAEPDTDAAAHDLASRARAWHLRCFVHSGQLTGSTAGSISVWDLQTTTVVRRFLLEQRTYRAHRRLETGAGA